MILRMEYVREVRPQLIVYGSGRAGLTESELISAFMQVHCGLSLLSFEKKKVEEGTLIGKDNLSYFQLYQIKPGVLNRWFKGI
ncbi:hypothetical protein HZC30_06580, partial [Candidatus Woesearchaeota archaeon]|nr:hypothetical protein [Candidatus Woesearchaeota archaeon]